MKHFIVYDPISGAVLRSGVCQDQDFQAQARDGEAVMEATPDAVVSEVNLDPVRTSICMKIDAEAEVARLQFITPGSGQAMVYLAKQAEAVTVKANASAPTPFLTAEAEATGSTVAALADTVLQKAAVWSAIGAKIEAARIKAKAAVSAASNIAEIHNASQVDWTLAQ